MTNNFKLQSVLDYRTTLERQAQQELADSIRQQEQILRNLAAKKQTLKQQCERFEQAKFTGLTVTDLVMYQSNIATLEQHISRLEMRLEHANQDLSDKRRVLTEKSLDCKILDNLKTRHREGMLKLLQRRELAALDEIALRSNKGELS